MGKPATTEEQEVLFQAIIRKIPAVADPARLQEISLLALALMLRRPTDHDLRAELTRQVHDTIAAIKPCRTPEGSRNEMRLAARGCLKALQAAKERRLPRHVTDKWAEAKPAPAHPHPHGGHHHAAPPKEEGRGALIAVAAVAALIILIGGFLLWNQGSAVDDSGPSETDRFVAQMVRSAEGNPPPSHLFGGIIRVTAMNGVPVVIAEGVPPRICSASGMKLVKKGLLSVNGTTPTRVSSAIITELCNRDGGNATLMWAPKN